MACPDENTLVAFASGGLPMGDATRVEEHLDTCGVCFSLVAELARADPDESDPTRMLPLDLDDGDPATSGSRAAPSGPSRQATADRTQIAPPPPPPRSSTAPPFGNQAPRRATTRPPTQSSSQLSMQSPGQPPTQLGRYTVLHRLGAGAMGVVYAAVDRELGRRVALKLVESGGPDAAERGARGLREAQALARLAHPNVVTVFDAGRVDGQVFVSMELVAGTTLGDWLVAEPRTWREILEVFVQAGRGVAAAHEAGIIHRDFKPSNVLVDDQGRARVVDFGLARAFGPVHDDAQTVIRAAPRDPNDLDSGVLGRSGSDLSRSGVVAGTPAYMAPEQYDGLGDARIDQFAFCVALFEALFGRRPFVARDLDALRARLGTGVPPEIPGGTDVPAWLSRIVLRGLSFDPERRFASMDALLAAITAAQRRRTVGRKGAVIGGGVAVVGIVATAVLMNAQAHPCDVGDARLVGIWDAPSIAAIERSVAAAGTPFGADAWASTRGIVDGWTAAWVDADAAQCHAREDDDAAGGACLDAQRSQLAAMTSVWVAADAGVVERLVEAAQSLDAPGACSGVVEPSAPLPFDPSAGVIALQIRDEVITARATAASGGSALARTEAAIDRASALGDDAPLLGELHLLRGELWAKGGQLGAAAPEIQRAMDIAIVRDQPGLLARAAVAAARLAADAGRAPEQILQLVAIGRAAIGRDGRPDAHAAISASLELAEAAAHRAASRPADATAALTRALDHRLAAGGEADLGAAAILVGLGEAAIAARTPAVALDHQRRALAIREGLLGGAHPLVAASCGGIAQALVATGRLDEARAFGQRALSILERALGSEDPRIADALGQLGVIEAELGHIDLALASHRRALAILERAQSGADLARALNRLGATLVTLGRWDEAEAALRRAAELGATAFGERSLELATTHFQLGRTAYGRGDFAAATAELTLALDTRRMLLGERDPSVAITGTWLARTRRDHGELDAAHTAASAALEILDPTVDPDSWAHAHLVVADVLWADGNRSAALDGMAAAIATLRAAPVSPTAVAMLEAWQGARAGDGARGR